MHFEYDALFDKGYISFTENLQTIISRDTSKFSNQLRERLEILKGKQLRLPLNKPLNKAYLAYHRTFIYEKAYKQEPF